jgi:hypothetical protein
VLVQQAFLALNWIQGVKSGYEYRPGALFQSSLPRGRCTLPGMRAHLLPGMHQRARGSGHLRLLSETSQHKGCQTTPVDSARASHPDLHRCDIALVILLSAWQGLTHHPVLLSRDDDRAAAIGR